MCFTRPDHFAIPAGPSLGRALTRLIVLIIFIVCASLVAVAQGGRITGKVVADIPGQRKAISDAVVFLTGDRLAGKKFQSISDEEGQYDFPGLTAGDYQLSVELTGFQKYPQKISVQIDATVEQDIFSPGITARLKFEFVKY